jgi:hypothetical protein
VLKFFFGCFIAAFLRVNIGQSLARLLDVFIFMCLYDKDRKKLSERERLMVSGGNKFGF